jgi:hypothetical protein
VGQGTMRLAEYAEHAEMKTVGSETKSKGIRSNNCPEFLNLFSLRTLRDLRAPPLFTEFPIACRYPSGRAAIEKVRPSSPNPLRKDTNLPNHQNNFAASRY